MKKDSKSTAGTRAAAAAGKTHEKTIHPVDNVFYQLFVQAYFRQNAGLFIFLFLLFFSSFFYINYLGEVPSSASFFWHFILMITMIRNQFMVMLFLVLASFYSLKTWLFVRTTLRHPSSSFMYLSFVQMPKSSQWLTWFRVQLKLAVPLLLYGSCCLVVAAVYHQLLYGVVIVLFLMLLSTAIAWLNYKRVLQYMDKGLKGKHRRRASQRRTFWKMHGVLLTFFFKRQQVALLITKIISILLLLSMGAWRTAEGFSWQQSALAILVIGATHALLTFKGAAFLEASLPVLSSLPRSRLAAFLFPCRTYMLLLIPETILFLLLGPAGFFLFAFITMLSFLCFFHFLSEHLHFRLKALFKVVFLLLCLYYLLTLYQLFWWIPVVNFLVTFRLFYSAYHCREERFF